MESLYKENRCVVDSQVGECSALLQELDRGRSITILFLLVMGWFLKKAAMDKNGKKVKDSLFLTLQMTLPSSNPLGKV